MRRLGFAVAALFVVAFASFDAAAAALTLDGPLTQGGLVRGKTEPGATVALDGRKIRVSAAGLFVIGFGRDAAADSRLEVTLADGTKEIRTLRVAPRDYDIQRVDGLPPRKVTPTKEDLERIRAEQSLIDAARRRDTDTPWFGKGFVWPARGRISGVYGSQRILNGEPRRAHLGIDIAAPVGTPAVAAADGVVSLARKDLFFTGGTLIIDHGFGVSSVYAHLSRLSVVEGQHVAQGEVVGAIGATGRATGPHLHWGLNLFDERLDPALLLGPMPVASD